MDIFFLYALSTLLFWALLLTPQLVKNTRQKLFNIRDKAFLDLEHTEEYYRFRGSLNALIRFAHNASWQRILFDLVMLKKEIMQQKNTKTTFDNSDLDKLFLESSVLIIRLMYLRSPTLILLSMPLVLLVVIKLEILPKLKSKLSVFVMNDANIYVHH